MNAVHEKRATAHVVLNIIWGVLSAILLVFVLYSSWEKAQLENHQSLWHAANEMTDQLDDFITDIMQSVYTMPIHGHDFNQCSTVLLSYLKHTVFNNPQISGLTIKNKQNQVICSTLLQADKQIVPNAQSLNLYGPIKFSTEDKPAFILQQQLGDYFIDVYVLQYLIEQQLKTTSPSIFRIALYNSNQNKVLLQITRESQSTVWQTDSPQQFIHFSANSDQPSFSIRDNLNSLEHFQLILFANPQQISQLAWGGIVMIALLMILGSFLIYFILRHLINRHFSLHRELIKAIKDKRFFPVYQPIFDNDRDVCIGAEVLLRWQDTQKIIMPDFFIEEAEQSGLIVPITLQLVETTFQQCQHALQAYKHFHLAFNLSAVHFANNQFFESFFNLCKQYKVSSHQLIFEITERDLLSKHDIKLVKYMKELRHAGFSLAVDDFGTGHASISYLQHFPFNYLKIDQLFVGAIGTGAITESLNQSIIHLAKNLNLQIIAEGVETLMQLEFLQDHGVTLMQGWYFAKALTIEQLLTLLRRGKYE